MSRILIVEDEPVIAMALQDDLELEGYEVQAASDGTVGLKSALEDTFDLILLDVMLPGRNGYEICREIRRSGLSTPILMLTARSTEAEKVLGLEMGADDYVTKPFSPLELRARVKALLRRSALGDASGTSAPLRHRGVIVDLERLTVTCNGQGLTLTHLEFKILVTLMQSPGRVFSRDLLLDLVWGSDVVVSDRAIDTHMANIRKKLDVDLIESVRGTGYRIVE